MFITGRQGRHGVESETSPAVLETKARDDND